MSTVDISVIIVNYNTEALLPKAIGDLKMAAKNVSLQIICIDNASRDNSVELLKREFSDCQLIANSNNVGFGRANNQALPYLKGRYVLLLNTDAFVSPDTLEKTFAYMEAHPECGILGVKLIGRDDVLQPSARYFPTPWNIFLASTNLSQFFKKVQMVDDMNWDHATVKSCDWVPGCYYLIKKEVVNQVGLFDPRYFLYYEEVDHCLATKRAGWQIHYFPDTTVVHIGGESAKSDGAITKSGRQLEALRIESELLYFRKNHGFLMALVDLMLITATDLINPVKRLFTGKRPIGFVDAIAHSFLAWTLFFRTRLGTNPTR